MAKTLNDTKRTILAAGAARDDLRVLPVPETVRLSGKMVTKMLGELLAAKLVRETIAEDGDAIWREDDNVPVTLGVTEAGLAAIGISPDAVPVELSAPDPRTSKQDALVMLLRREQGASLDEMMAADGLDLHALRRRWRELYRTPAPQGFRRELLIRAVAYRLQEQALGGLSSATRRKLLRIANRAEGGEGFTTADAPRHLAPGTRLVRDWKGTVHTVEVLEDGYAWQDQRFTSLSAIAREITGTSWNGKVFFGVGNRNSNAGDTDADA